MAKAFFQQFQTGECTLYPYLLQKTRLYRQPSATNPRSIHDVNYIKKYCDIPKYISFVSGCKVQRMDILSVQEVIQEIYRQYWQYFAGGGWRNVKNKSLKGRMQEYLLLKLAQQLNEIRQHGSFDKYILSFFFTLNYLKMANNQIKLFTEMLDHNYDLDLVFLFVMMRGSSRRRGRQLYIPTELLCEIVQIMEGQKYTSIRSSRNIQSIFTNPLESIEKKVEVEKNQEMKGSICSEKELNQKDFGIKEIRLVITFDELLQFMKNRQIVLHQIAIFSLMTLCGAVPQYQSVYQFGKIDWQSFLELYFIQITKQHPKHFQNILLAAIIQKNIEISNKIQQKQEYLEESFTYLISILEGLFKRRLQGKLMKTYESLEQLYEMQVIAVNSLLRAMFKTKEFYIIFKKYANLSDQSIIE